jgi:hypothetical protein
MHKKSTIATNSINNTSKNQETERVIFTFITTKGFTQRLVI